MPINNKNEIKEELAEDGSQIGIEAEPEENILEPFDPNSISIQTTPVAMDALIRRLKQNSINLAPDFQRSEVWDITRRSRLIESLMLNIPLPMFYVAADEDGKWGVVDGLQRLSTIRDFISGDKEGKKLKLKNLEFLGKKFDGKTFDDIESNPAQIRLLNTIMETVMSFTVINPGTPEEVKRNIFKRINTGGMPLTPQEIRHALYQGQSSDLLMDLIMLPEFKAVMNRNINDSRMGARELVLRFIAFLIFPIEYYKSDMDKFLSNAMRVVNCMPDMNSNRLSKIFKDESQPEIKLNQIQIIKDKFILGMTRGKQLFSDHAFRKSLKGTQRKSPINKALFEAWSNVLCQLSKDEFDVLIAEKAILFELYQQKLDDNDFNNSISRHATQTKGVLKRYEAINEIVGATLMAGKNDHSN